MARRRVGDMTPKEEKAVRKLEERYGSASLKPSDAIPSPLYHYTSAGGLVGIVSSGVLRASNFSYLNDSTEIQYGQQLAQDVIWERLETEQTSINLKVLACVQKAIADIGRRVDFYLACFCTEPDLLSQWRGYGSARGRFCIGFDTEDLPSSLKYTLFRVLYNEAEQRRKVQRAIDTAVETLADGSSEKFLERVADLLADKLVGELYFFKHPGFAEEHEWRAVHAVEPTDMIKFDTTSGLIKPFVDLWVGSEQEDGFRRLPIAEVLVGPAASLSLSVRSVNLLLARHGYRNVEIKESALPYREM
jgi:hypothetical protein